MNKLDRIAPNKILKKSKIKRRRTKKNNQNLKYGVVHLSVVVAKYFLPKN